MGTHNLILFPPQNGPRLVETKRPRKQVRVADVARFPAPPRGPRQGRWEKVWRYVRVVLGRGRGR